MALKYRPGVEAKVDALIVLHIQRLRAGEDGFTQEVHAAEIGIRAHRFNLWYNKRHAPTGDGLQKLTAHLAKYTKKTSRKAAS